MSKTIAVLGANGVYARHLIPRLTSGGWKIRALARRPEAAGVAAACGAEICVADIFDGESLRAGLAGCDIAVNLATSLPGPSGRGDFAANDRLRRHGTPVFVEACRAAGVARILQQSIALVNASDSDAWSDEGTVFPDTGESVARDAIAAALDMEKTVASSGADYLILRGALFYGPGTGYDDEWFERAKAGKLRLPGDGSKYVSFVHIADMAAATVTAISRWPSRETMIIADEEPATWKEVFSYLTQCAGAPAPQPGGQMGFPSFRVRNRKAKDILGWEPFYRNYRSGMAR